MNYHTLLGKVVETSFLLPFLQFNYYYYYYKVILFERNKFTKETCTVAHNKINSTESQGYPIFYGNIYMYHSPPPQKKMKKKCSAKKLLLNP